jgi:hypothetical protein
MMISDGLGAIAMSTRQMRIRFANRDVPFNEMFGSRTHLTVQIHSATE